MGQFARRIIGFRVYAGDVEGIARCRVFNRTISRISVPRYMNSDHAPLFSYYPWQANLRILEVEEIKTVIYVPSLAFLRPTADQDRPARVP